MVESRKRKAKKPKPEQNSFVKPRVARFRSAYDISIIMNDSLLAQEVSGEQSEQIDAAKNNSFAEQKLALIRKFTLQTKERQERKKSQMNLEHFQISEEVRHQVNSSQVSEESKSPPVHQKAKPYCLSQSCPDANRAFSTLKG